MNRTQQIILTITMTIVYSFFMAMVVSGCAPIETQTAPPTFKPEVYQEYEYYSDCVEYQMPQCFS